MKALCWHGSGDIRCESVPDPKILDPRDAIIKVTTCAICGSDLHILNGFVPNMKSGDILGHETMGEVVDVGSEAKSKLKIGDRVVVPFTIACGECRMCKMGHWSCCQRSNPAGAEQAKEMGYPTSGLYGYSHAYGGFSGGQAQFLRVPFADVGPIKVPDSLSDEQVLFLSDIFPTGYHAAVNCDIQPGQTIAVFGCGPVGLFAIKSCFMLGASRVIAIDTVPERLALAKQCGAETIDFRAVDDVTEVIKQMTAGNGPDATIEAVGLESHGHGGIAESIKTHATHMERAYALEMAIKSVRPAGTVSLPGVFIGNVSVPMGMYVGKALTMKTGQTPVQTYLRPLMDKIASGQIDPSFLITHRIKIEDGPDMYKTFRDKKDGCIKIVIKPNG